MNEFAFPIRRRVLLCKLYFTIGKTIPLRSPSAKKKKKKKRGLSFKRQRKHTHTLAHPHTHSHLNMGGTHPGTDVTLCQI